MRDDIEKIIADGILAPSGENCQPWRFVIKNQIIHIFNVPEADQSLYNFKQRGSYIAHGALIENISISAAQHGYLAHVMIFPDKNEPNLVCAISLSKTKPQNQPLYYFIAQRHTNRKEHHPKKLSPEQKKDLSHSITPGSDAEFKIIDDQNNLKILGKAISMNEQILFENKALHDFFYSHILWRETDQNKKNGFYIKTLEFLPMQLKGVKLLKRWGLLKILNTIAGVSKIIGKDNAGKYARSGAIAILTTNGNTDTDYINSGREAQRVWLTATKLGLSVHPCTGVLFFMERIRGGDKISFSNQHTELIKSAYNNIVEVFGAEGKTIPMLFRIGFADPPTAHALRIKPIIEYSPHV